MQNAAPNPQLSPRDRMKITQPYAPAVPEGKMAKVIPIRESVGDTLGIPEPIKDNPVGPRRIEKIKLKPSEILDGAGLNSLDEGIKEYITASGDKVWAATDKGLKDKNEDRVVVDPAYNLAVVIDGMGGMGKGEEAAQLSAESFLQHPDDPVTAAISASNIIKNNEKMGSAGACYASTRIIIDENGKKYLETSNAGDVKVLILRKGKLIFESHDDSYVQALIDSGKITKDEALYHPERNTVTKGISATHENFEFSALPLIPLEKGDLVMGLSDGIIDNITPQEIEEDIIGLKPAEIIHFFSNTTNDRMKNYPYIINDTEIQGGRAKLGQFSDGFLSAPKIDNRGVAIIEIN